MAKSKSIPEILLGIVEGFKSYLSLRLEYIRVTSMEKLVDVLSSLLLMVLMTATAFIVMLFLSMAFVWWYGEIIDDMALAFLLISGIWILMALIIFLFRNQLIINPLIKKVFSGVALKEQAEKPLKTKDDDGKE